MFANSSYQDCLTVHRVFTAFMAACDVFSSSSEDASAAGVIARAPSSRRIPARSCRLEHPDDYEVGSCSV
jgi:hypothetical protein